MGTKPNIKKLLILPFFLIPVLLFAQKTGLVTDSLTGKPLAFVSVQSPEDKQYTQTDIDGKFKLKTSIANPKVIFTYLGYQSYTQVLSKNYTSIQLSPSTTNIKEVSILAGENPAHRIVKLAIANRNKNNPEKYSSFTYTAYNKFVLGVKRDMFNSSGFVKDSTDTIEINKVKNRTDSILKQHDLFITETVTERQFLYPDLSKETIVAQRASGFKNPQFSLIASQLQSFSIYNDVVKLQDKTYLSPLAPNSFNKYFFNIEDTTYNGADTVFIVSFKPKKDKNFDGLKGTIYINTNGYAAQNIIAEPAEIASLDIKIQQQYAPVNGYWFPQQLNTDIVFTNIVLNGFPAKGIGRSYLSNIEIGAKVKSRSFNENGLEYAPGANNNPDSLLKMYRSDSTSVRDKQTYKFMDSIGKEENFEKKLNTFIYLSKGYIPVSFININLNKLLDENRYEGFRVGLGLRTNNKFSKYFDLGGYAAYGFKDKGIKYGYDINIPIYKPKQVELSASYIHDVTESGVQSFEFDKEPIAAKYRRLFVVNMDKIDVVNFGIKARLLSYLQVSTGYKSGKQYFTSTYRYTDELYEAFGFGTYYLNLRYAFRETYATQFGEKISLGTKYPVVYLSYSDLELNRSSGNEMTNVKKLELKLSYKFITRNLGKTNITVRTGQTFGAAPYSLQFVGLSNYSSGFSLVGEQCFETMRFNEFVLNRFAFGFLKHSFNSLLFKTKAFAPQLSVAFNYGIGENYSTSQHYLYPIKTIPKGYAETGIVIDDILKFSGLFSQGFGLGVYYRLGAYSFATPKDNLAVKLAYRLQL